MAGEGRHGAHERHVAASVASYSFVLLIMKKKKKNQSKEDADAVLQGEDQQHGERRQGAHRHLQSQSSREGTPKFVCLDPEKKWKENILIKNIAWL